MLRRIELRVSRQVIGRSAADDTAADDDNAFLSILVLVGHCGEVASRLKSVGETCGRRCVLPANSLRSQSLENERSDIEIMCSEVLETLTPRTMSIERRC